jgi:hypothetical protein
LTITSPFVHSRVDSNTFIMGNPMPESTLSLCQSQLYPPVRDFRFGLCTLQQCRSSRVWSLKQKYSRLSEVSQLWYYRPTRLHRLGLCSLVGRYEVAQPCLKLPLPVSFSADVQYPSPSSIKNANIKYQS